MNKCNSGMSHQKSGDVDSFGKQQDENSFDAASISQVRLEGAYFGGFMETAAVKPVAPEENSGDSIHPEVLQK